MAFKAAEDSRRLTLPKTPEDLKLALTKNFKPPEGIEFVPDEKDPLLPQAKTFALKHGLSQEAFSELLDLHAAGQIGSMQHVNNAKAAEVAKLGPTGTARKTAVDTWLTAQVGEELGKELSTYTFTAKQIEGFEALIRKWTTQGASSFDPRHGEVNQPGKVSQAEYDAMTFSEKRAYGAKFGNPTVQANGRA